MGDAIQLDGLFRSFRSDIWSARKTQVLTDVNLRVGEGTIVGLLGRNGAGKTTLLHCALGLLKPDAGSCRLFGEESWNAPAFVRQRLGFVPQRLDTYLWMTLEAMCNTYGGFYEGWDQAYANELMGKLDVPRFTTVGRLSEGEKQKAAIVLAMAHRPDLLVLDEPVASLDAVSRHAFMDLLFDLYMETGKTIVFSSHILSDVERIATDVAYIRDGHISLCMPLDDLKERIIRLRLGCDQVNHVVEALPNVLFQSIDGTNALVTLAGAPEGLLDRLRAEGVSIQVEQLNLEDIFVELSR